MLSHMRKLITCFMIATFIISIFDVVDIYDLCHEDGTQIFLTSNPHADNHRDSLGDKNFQYTTVENFFLPAFPHICNIKRTLLSGLAPDPKPVFFYNYSPGSNNRPPKFII